MLSRADALGPRRGKSDNRAIRKLDAPALRLEGLWENGQYRGQLIRAVSLFVDR